MALILIVDDDEMDRVLSRWHLEDTGHDFLFAPDGKTALKLYEEEDIDLVITDLAMPDLNGLRLIQAVLELDRHAKIIAVSGVSPELLPRAEDLGAVLALIKPVRREDLVGAVRDILEGPGTVHDLFGGR